MTALSLAIDSTSATELRVRVLSGVLAVLPFAPAWTHPGSLAEQAGSERAATLAEQAAAKEGAVRAREVLALLDKADLGVTLFSVGRGAVKTYRKEDGAWEVDPQQGVDAALKALGIAWAAHSLLNGNVGRLAELRAGRALLAWYVAADLVLPFADNVAEGGVALLTGTIDRFAPEAAARLASLGGPDATASTGALQGLLTQVRGLAEQAATAAGPLNEWAKGSLPGMIGTVDSVSGAAATAADALSVYEYLGVMLVAEVCAAEGAAAHAAEQAAAAEAQRAAAAARAEALVREEQARREDEARRLAASAQREDYSLEKAEAAASVALNPIKVTRSGGDVALAPAGGPPARSGCFGCAGVLLVGLGLASGAVSAASALWA